MDARSLKLLSQIDTYLETPPPGVPEQLISSIQDLREMITAPRFSGESPGEQEAREVSEQTMPQDTSDEYYSNESESQNENVGVFSPTN